MSKLPHHRASPHLDSVKFNDDEPMFQIITRRSTVFLGCGQDNCTLYRPAQ